jgi:hypothetical protein
MQIELTNKRTFQACSDRSRVKPRLPTIKVLSCDMRADIAGGRGARGGSESGRLQGQRL